MNDPTPASAFRSVPDLWLHRVDSTPDVEAFSFRRGGGWVSWTWTDTHDQVRRLAGALLAAGLEPATRCAILSATRIEWIVADLAILCSACATTTIFPTASDADLVHILTDSGARWVFADTPDQVARLRRFRDQLPALERVIAFDAPSSEDGWVMSLSEAQNQGEAFLLAHPDAFAEAASQPTEDSLATLIYTSGTTGRPKGVMLSHGSWIYEAEAVDALGVLTPADRQLLFLPLAHVFAKVLEVIAIRLGMSTVVEGRASQLLDVLQETHPTWLAGVPHVFDRIRRMVHNEAQANSSQATALRWALATAEEAQQRREAGEPIGPLLRGRLLVAERTVFRRLRTRMGGRLRFLISGAAPLSNKTAAFFEQIGVPLCQGYGLTESSAASFTNVPDGNRMGTVGRPLAGVDVRIAEDGEILLQSRGLMQGYWGLPGPTAEHLIDGWLHTGDIGRLDADGYLTITGRKKAMLITAGGKNVSPPTLEQGLVEHSDWIDHAVWVGEARPYCVVVVTLDVPTVARWCREQGLAVTDYASMASRPEVLARVTEEVESFNAPLSPWERARKVLISPQPFTQDNQLLTPTLKVRREAVVEHLSDPIDALYEQSRVTRRVARR